MANKTYKYKVIVEAQKDQQSFSALKAELDKIQNLTVKDLIKTENIKDATAALQDAKGAAQALEKAMEAAYNPKLDKISLDKFYKEISKTKGGLSTMQSQMNGIGSEGATAFRKITTQLLTTNKNLRESAKWLDKMAETMGNTVRWSITSNALNAVTSSIQQAYGFAKNLDTSLNDIRIVTEKSADDMAKFAVQANKAAKALGQSTKAYTDASLIYYQQGLSDQEAQARASTTLKAANVTGQNAAAVSEQLTAVWNGYKVSAQEAELYVDKLAAVAASTAADLEELSVGMSRVASAANIMGVDIDQLNAQLATIVSVTREAPESIGTALKTVFARMTDIEAGLDTETTLGEYTSQMANLGIHVLDASGSLRDMGDVIEEIGGKWGSFSREQQTALAQTIAGTRQYSRMMALFDNWDMYTEALNTSANAAGTLQKQQDIYMESTEAHLAQLQAQSEELYTTLFDTNSVNTVVDTLTQLVGVIDNVIKGLGGGIGLLSNLGAVGAHVFHNQISKGLSRVIGNITKANENLKQQIALQKILADLNIPKNKDQQTESQKKIYEYATKIVEVQKLLSDEEYNLAQDAIKDLDRKQTELDLLKKEQKAAEDLIHTYTTLENVTINDQGEILKDGQLANLNEINKELNQVADSWQTIGESIKNATEALEANQSAMQEKTTTNRSIGANKGLITRNKKELELLEQKKQALYGQATLDYEAESFKGEKLTADQKTNTNQLIKEIEEKQRVLKEQIKIAENRINDLSNEIPIQDFTQLNETFKSLQDNSELLKGAVDALDFDDASEEAKELKSALGFLKNTQEITADNQEEFAKVVSVLSKHFGENHEKLAALIKDYPELAKALGLANKNAKEAESGFKAWLKSLDMTKKIDTVTRAVSGLSNAVNSIQNLKNLGSIWSDEDMSAGEKFAATLSAVTMAMTSFGFAISDFKALGPVVSDIWKKLSADATLNTVATQINTEATKKNADEQRDQAAATQESGNAMQQDATQTNINSGATGTNTFTTKLKTAGGKLKTAGGKVKTAGSNLIKSAFKNPVGKLGGVAAFAIGAVAASAAVWHVVDNSYNKQQKAFEAAQEQAQEAAKAYAQVSSAVQQIEDTLDGWHDKQEAIATLTKGTEEYTKAVEEANKELLALVANNQELQSALQYDDKTGLYSLDTTKESLFLQEQRNRETTAELTKQSAQIDAIQAETNAKIEQSRTDFNVNKEEAVVDGASAILSAVGVLGLVAVTVASMGTALPAIAAVGLGAAAALGVSPIVSEAIAAGGLNEVFEDRIDEQSLTTAVNKLNDGTINLSMSAEEIAKRLDFSLDEAQALKENSAALEKLANEVKNNTLELRSLNLQSSRTIVQGSNYVGTQQETLSYIVATQYEEQYQKFRVAAENMGKDYLKEVYENVYNGTFDGDDFTYQDGDTEKTEEVSEEALYIAYAAEMTRQYFNTQMHGIASNVKEQTQTIAKELFGDTDFTSIAKAQELIDLAKGTSAVDLSLFTAKELSDLKGQFEKGLLTPLQEIIKAQGSTQSDAISTFTTAYDSLITEFTAATQEFNTLYDRSFESLFNNMTELQNMAYPLQTQFVTFLNQAEIFGEQENPIVSFFEGIQKNVDNELLTDIFNLDWAAEDIEEQFNEVLENAEVTADFDDVHKFVNEWKILNGVIEKFDLEAVKEEFAELQSLSNIKLGDTISKESFDLLYEQIGSQIYEFFTQTGAGMYMLTADAAEFYNLIAENGFRNRWHNKFATLSGQLVMAQTLEREQDFVKDQVAGLPSLTKYSQGYASSEDINQYRELIASAYEAKMIDDTAYKQYIAALGAYQTNIATTSEFRELLNNANFDNYTNNATWTSPELGGVRLKHDFSAEEINAAVRVLKTYKELNPNDTTFMVSGGNFYTSGANAITKSVQEAIEDLQTNPSAISHSTLQVLQLVRSAFESPDKSFSTGVYTGVNQDLLNTFLSGISAFTSTSPDDSQTEIIDAIKVMFQQATNQSELDVAKEVADSVVANQGLALDVDDLYKEAEAALKAQREALFSSLLVERNESDDISIQLDAVNQSLSNLAKAITDGAFQGNVLVKALEEYGDLVEEQKKLAEEQLGAYQKQLNANEETSPLKSFYDKLSSDQRGKYFNEDGTLKATTTRELLTQIRGDNDLGLSIDIEALEADVDEYFTLLYTTIPQAQQALEEYGEDYISLLEESYLNVLNQITEELDKQLGYYDAINDTQQSMIDMADLFGESYDDLNTRYQAILDNNKKSLVLAEEAVREAMAVLDDTVTHGFGEQGFEQLNSSLSTLISYMQSSTEAIFAQYENTLAGIFEAEDAESMNLQWEHIKDNSAKYLDNVNKAYAIEKLSLDISQEMDKYSSEKIQQKINQFKERELALLRAENDLTQHHLDMVEAEFNILKAQIALEEARENTTSMRLRMGADGGYSYQYIADEDQIREKEAALAEAENKKYNLIKDAYTSSVDNILSIQNEWQSAATEASDAETLALINSIYSTKMSKALAENSEAYVSAQSMGVDLEDTEWQAYFDQMDVDSISSEITDAFGDKTEAESDLKGLEELIAEAMEKMGEFAGTGQDSYEVIQTISDTVISIAEMLGREKYFGSFVEKSGEIFNAEGQSVSESAANFGGGGYEVKDHERLKTALIGLFGAKGTTELDQLVKQHATSEAGGKWETFLKIITDDEFIWGKNFDALEKILKSFGFSFADLLSYDTGGYTGEWGSFGRIAMVHEKELILNKEDTANILDTVALVRDITSNLQNMHLSRMAVLDNLHAAFPDVETNQTAAPIQQDVRIEASFPSVDVAAEVEEALVDVINLAAQYANSEEL